MLSNWSKKLEEKFPSTTLGCTMVKIFCLDNTFLEILELEASPEVSQ